MNLNDVLSSAKKSKRSRRVGRGIGSGRGKTSGRGHKGYGSRAGAKKRLGYEGGQAPIISRIPKRGFSNAQYRNDFQIVNVSDLDRFEQGARVDAEALAKMKLIRDADKPLKVLGNGKLTRKLTVAASKFSASAVEKITQAGGSIEEV